MLCPKCGNNIEDGDLFCSECGYNPPKKTTTEEKEELQTTKLRCPKCGAKNDEGDSFCSECGSSLNTGAIKKECRNIHYSRWEKPFNYPLFVEIIFYTLLTVGMTIFAIVFFMTDALSPEYSSADIKNADSIFEQIYYMSSNSEHLISDLGGRLFLGMGITVGILFIIAFWCVFKFHQIEKRIIETQEMVNKRGLS